LEQIKDKSVPNQSHLCVVKSQIETGSRMTYEEHLMYFLNYSNITKSQHHTEEKSRLFFCL